MGYGPANFIGNGTLLPYSIHFENDTNATAPAQQVFIIDQLTNTLDWQTFELTEIAFGDHFIAVPPKTQHFEKTEKLRFNGVDFELQIEAGIHLANGQVYATFRSLNPTNGLPPTVDIGFLPPENGTGRGMGHIGYTIRAHTNLVTGTEIRNVASIQFDYNPPLATDLVDPHNPASGIDTNKQALNTIDANPPGSAVNSLPATVTSPSFVVCWTGNDVGAGIASYDIHVSTNGGTWGLWLANTTNTCATFTGQNGHTYSFYSIARDHVGHIEAPPSVRDALTTVDVPEPFSVAISRAPLPSGQGERITLTYPTTVGRNYTVEFRDSLGPASVWQPLSGAPHNSGTVIQTNILSQRFYRVQIGN